MTREISYVLAFWPSSKRIMADDRSILESLGGLPNAVPDSVRPRSTPRQ